MNIIHYNPTGDSIIAEYIDTLCKSMEGRIVCRCANSINHLNEELSKEKADIINIHGCWHRSVGKVYALARQYHTRIVLTPHGDIEPWVMARANVISSLLIPQKLRLFATSYATIVMGKMEREAVERYKANKRVETIACSLFTSATTDEEMAQKTISIYQKVLDSNVTEIMDNETHDAITILCKTAITADTRWTSEEEAAIVRNLTTQQWRQIELYGFLTHTLKHIARGARILGTTMPECNPETIAIYPPKRQDNGTNDYVTLLTLTTDNTGLHTPTSIVEAFGKIIRKIQKNKIGILDIVNLTDMLYKLKTDEDELRYLLDDRQMTKWARRLMALVTTSFKLPEGFLVVPTLYDRTTKKIFRQLSSQLKI
ncbi:hypothetical protein CIK99_05990 [Prevotella sp. P5-92]|uniref:hypothetical protein n=1 Tax=Prevotella sp. P5-92 TaxID=2024222 RepID=UPI000B979C80|nr:hypothetical protein [Prevotella sp. P5-92]OYP57771.1 hypothetical protein CIK99_05990 [Prevotella sp. P5-92]